MPGAKETGPFRFAVAFSYAGTNRERVRAIAERVSAALDPGLADRSKGHVFFDEWFEHELLGDDADVLLQRFYHQQSRMVVAEVSGDYAGRPWCQAEARAIRALRFEIDPARDETGRLRLLNLQLGAGEVPGIFKTTVPLDGVKKSAEECAEVILKRHALLVERMGVEGVGRSVAPGNGVAVLPHPGPLPLGEGEGRAAMAGAQRPAETAAPPAPDASAHGAASNPTRTMSPPLPAGEGRGEGERVPEPTSGEPQSPARGWVWHATLETRAAGQWSVLAVVETVAAVALYWWIAWYFETHLHLLTSAFIARCCCCARRSQSRPG